MASGTSPSFSGNRTTQDVLAGVGSWIDQEFVKTHKANSKKIGNLENVNINPFLLRYLSNLAYGDATPHSMAKVIVYTRALGSSPSTTFGNTMRKFCTEKLNDKVVPHSGSEADVKYYDHIDKKYCWARLRLGPDNMNSRTAGAFVTEFKSLAKSNPNAQGSCVVGVLYGEDDSINASFKSLKADGISVFVGKDFWHRVTGDSDFYNKLVEEIEKALGNVSDRYLGNVITKLDKELATSGKFSRP